MEQSVTDPSFGLGREDIRDQLGQFGEMVVRDYLNRRGLTQTLKVMTEETRAKGQPAPTMSAWTTMAGLLGLSELMRANDASGNLGSMLEVLTQELVREQSIKMRKPVTLQVLSAAPSCAERASATSLAATLTRAGAGPGADPRAELPRGNRRERRKPPVPPAPTLLPGELAGRPTTLAMPLGSKLTTPVGVQVAPGARAISAHARALLSNERWIPMDRRERMLQRDLAVTKTNVMNTVARQRFVETDKRLHALSELEQNHVEERYGLKSKKKCGLCRQEFSLINLVLEVPIKAIKDLRATWADEHEPHPAHVRECAERKKEAFAYDRVGVCVLCSQFFQLGQQDVYRPSYEKKCAEKSRKLRKEAEAAAKRYWDPVKRLEEDRRTGKAGAGALEPGVLVPPAPLAQDD